MPSENIFTSYNNCCYFVRVQYRPTGKYLLPDSPIKIHRPERRVGWGNMYACTDLNLLYIFQCLSKRLQSWQAVIFVETIKYDISLFMCWQLHFYFTWQTISTVLRKKFVVIHRVRCSNKVHYVLPHDVVTWDGDHDVSF